AAFGCRPCAVSRHGPPSSTAERPLPAPPLARSPPRPHTDRSRPRRRPPADPARAAAPPPSGFPRFRPGPTPTDPAATPGPPRRRRRAPWLPPPAPAGRPDRGPPPHHPWPPRHRLPLLQPFHRPPRRPPPRLSPNLSRPSGLLPMPGMMTTRKQRFSTVLMKSRRKLSFRRPLLRQLECHLGQVLRATVASRLLRHPCPRRSQH